MAAGYRSGIQLLTDDSKITSDLYFHDVGNIESGGFNYTKFKVACVGININKYIITFLFSFFDVYIVQWQQA